MSGLDLGALGLVADETAPAAPAAPAEPAPVAPAAPADPAPEPTPEPTPEDEIVVPEGAENPDAVRNLIAAERAAARSAYKRARDAEAKLAQIEEASMPAEQRIAAAQARAEAAELRAQKLLVGTKHGLSVTLSELLQGSDEESLEKSAQTILTELGSRPATPAPSYSLNGGYQTPPPASVDPHKAHAQFLGQLLGRRTGA